MVEVDDQETLASVEIPEVISAQPSDSATHAVWAPEWTSVAFLVELVPKKGIGLFLQCPGGPACVEPERCFLPGADIHTALR